jgi:hypothetical protein
MTRLQAIQEFAEQAARLAGPTVYVQSPELYSACIAEGMSKDTTKSMFGVDVTHFLTAWCQLLFFGDNPVDIPRHLIVSLEKMNRPDITQALVGGQ